MPRHIDPAQCRLLITGANGFLGRHVLDRLKSYTRVTTLVRSVRPSASTEQVVGDLNDPESVLAAVQAVQPQGVIHLAGVTPPTSARECYASNTMGTLTLLDALRSLNQPVRVVVTGSAAELGPVGLADLPVGEDYEPRPAESYGLSKLLASTAALAARPPLEVMVARIFNPIGPGVPATQALGRFAAIIARSSEPNIELSVGDLSPKRDFVDVRDVANALVRLLEGGSPNRLYHVGTGESHSIQEGLDALSARSGVLVTTRFDPELARRTGPADSRASISRIRDEVGWTPHISWEQSLADLWDEARLRLTAPARPV